MAILYYAPEEGNNRYLRISHFLLAIYCRAENNRFYLKRHVTLRPGYLAKWIEFIIDKRYIPEDVMKEKCKVDLIDPDESMDIQMQQRLTVMERNLQRGNLKREEAKRMQDFSNDEQYVVQEDSEEVVINVDDEALSLNLN